MREYTKYHFATSGKMVLDLLSCIIACTSCDDRGRVVSNIVDAVKAASRPESSFKSTSRKDIYLDCTLSAARAHVEGARLA
jgi:hypothetical protein